MKKFKDKFYCSECSSNFYVIEGVVFALNNTYDFFNINRKIKRFLEFKRDERIKLIKDSLRPLNLREDNKIDLLDWLKIWEDNDIF